MRNPFKAKPCDDDRATTELYGEMYLAATLKWSELLKRLALDPDSSPDDVIGAAQLVTPPDLGDSPLSLRHH